VTNFKVEVIDEKPKEDAKKDIQPLVEEPDEVVNETIKSEPEEETQTFLLNSKNELLLSKFE
jgi:hypothetical protein